MTGQVVSSRPSYPFEFVLVEGDSSHGDVVIASSNQISPWIDPTTIKLRHRIGRGPFGDVWLATHHFTAEDYQEYHEVAVKMLHPVKEDRTRDFLNKLDNIMAKCHGLETVCWLHGLSIINKSICIVMKFYEGSVGDKMTRYRGGKLSLTDVLRYGADLAQGIMDLHAKGILILNLKPSNFLLTTNEQAIIGDIGIPYVLLGTPSPCTDVSCHVGTPNYMAPEQWKPDVRGPLSFETDSWGFGCSVLEMITGKQPWSGKSIDEIYSLVVLKQQKPQIPSGLPLAIENVIIGCFNYDFRNRPLMADIIHAFKSSQSAISEDEIWSRGGSKIIREKPGNSGYSEWFLAKDHLQVGDTVRSRKSPRCSNLKNMDVPEGNVVGLERNTDQDGFVLVRLHGVHDPIRVDVSTLERVTLGLAAGDWVRLKNEEKNHSSVGILHQINREGSVAVAFIGLETLWKGECSDLEMAKPYTVGQFVKLKSSIISPRFEWPRKRGGEWTTGRISQILPNGCLVMKFPGILSISKVSSNTITFLGDPSEVELVSFNTCPTLVKKYQHLEDFHWAIRPVLAALSLFTAVKLGLFIGMKVGIGRMRGGKTSKVTVDSAVENHSGESQSHSDVWRPPKVTDIFR